MSTAQLLDEVLTSLGYPPVDAPPDLSVFGYDAPHRTIYTGNRALFEPLWQRGWCVHFDAEGRFSQPQEHSKLIAALLTLAGVHPLPEIREHWVRAAGWVFEIRSGQRHVVYHFRDANGDTPSDYCELGLVKALLDDWLAPDHTLVHFPTGGQDAFCGLMPTNVYKELCEWVFIVDVIDVEGGGEMAPSADRLVLWPSRDRAEYTQDVVVLTPEQADRMCGHVPSDWWSAR